MFSESTNATFRVPIPCVACASVPNPEPVILTFGRVTMIVSVLEVQFVAAALIADRPTLTPRTSIRYVSESPVHDIVAGNATTLGALLFSVTVPGVVVREGTRNLSGVENSVVVSRCPTPIVYLRGTVPPSNEKFAA